MTFAPNLTHLDQKSAPDHTHSKMLSFRHPTTILIAGPTQAGKSFFFKQVLENDLIQPSPSRIIYVYGESHPDLSNLKLEYDSVEFVQGIKNFIPLLSTIDPSERNVVVIDDQMQEAGNMEEVSNLFTKGSHHRNITAVYIVQNVFDKGKIHRTISLNSHYIVLFKNPRDQGQARNVAQQVFPNKVKIFITLSKMQLKNNMVIFCSISILSPRKKLDCAVTSFEMKMLKFILRSIPLGKRILT